MPTGQWGRVILKRLKGIRDCARVKTKTKVKKGQGVGDP